MIAALGWQTTAAAVTEAEQEHQRALELAREGRHDPAIERLAALTERFPGNAQYLHDHITVLAWAGRDSEALGLGRQLELETTPAYTLEALGKSARNQRDYPFAIEVYKTVIEKNPGRAAGHAGLALSLADSGDTQGALAVMDQLDAARSSDTQILTALAYVQLLEGDLFQALATCDRVLRIDPGNEEARKGRIMIALRLGAPHLASDMAEQAPGLLTPDERDAIERDRLATIIRWSRLPAAPQTMPEREAYAAILKLRQELEWLEAGNQGDSPHARTIRYDLLVSLQERHRSREVIELYETRVAGKDDVPTYVLNTVAEAYLEQRQPERARDLLLRSVEREPADFDARLALFYAYVEAEDFERALPLIDELAAAEPAWIGVAPYRRSNPNKLHADIAAALGRAFADDYEEAERRVAPLAERAPHNSELHATHAYIHLWRGWPRRALGEFEIARNGQPADLLDARIGRAQVLMSLGEYPRAEEALEEARQADPGRARTASLAREWELHNMRELRLEMYRTDSSGVQEGAEDLGFDGWIYSAPLRYHYRAYLHHHFAQAEFPEGTASYRRLGAGVEYRARDLWLTTEVDRDAGDSVNAGVAVSGRWTPSDYWSFTAGLDSHSDEIPLRGRLAEDIEGWSADIGADWRSSELRSVHAGARSIDFSDDNRRTSANVLGVQRLLTRSRYRLDGLLGFYASRNTRGDAPYFNPEQDFSADLTLDSEWLLFRRYDHAFRHRLALSVGTYHQQDFGSNSTWAARYEQRWNPADRTELSYGLMRARRVYDGVAEYQTTLYLNLDWRF